MSVLIQVIFNDFFISIWRQSFLVISIFGFYLSVVIIISSLLKSRVNVFPGLYTAGISLTLFYLISDGLIPSTYERLINYAGIGSIFLIGQFAYHSIFHAGTKKNNIIFLIHYLPSILFISIIINANFVNTFIYTSGILYIGVYILFTSISFYNKSSHTNISIRNSENRNNQLKLRFIIILNISYALVVASILIFDSKLFKIISSIILSLQIIYIWIRLLRSSFNRQLFKQY